MLYLIFFALYDICTMLDELFDGESLLAVQSADTLRALGIPFGPIQKIMKIIENSKIVSCCTL